MQKILVPVRGDGKGDNVFAHAVGLARRSGAHIQVTHCRSRPEDMIPYGVAVSPVLKEQIIEQSVNLLNKQEQGLREEILALAQANGAILAKPSDDDTVTVSFIEEEGRQIEVIRHHGLLSDMTAVAQPDLDRNIDTNTLQAALFSTGRPVMMCLRLNQKFLKIWACYCCRWGWFCRIVPRCDANIKFAEISRTGYDYNQYDRYYQSITGRIIRVFGHAWCSSQYFHHQQNSGYQPIYFGSSCCYWC